MSVRTPPTATRPAVASRVASRQTRAWSLLLSVAGVVVALLYAARSDPAAMTDIGLVSTLPWPYWAGVLAVVAGFATGVLAHRPAGAVLAGHVVATVVVLFGTPAVVEGLPRLEASYRHLGIVDHIASTGQVDAGIDAYFNWHGFFALAAFVGDLTGVPPGFPLATWAPLIASLALIVPLLLVVRAFTDDVRVQWTAVWLFFLANWTGQDYFAPQTWAFWLYLTALGLVMALGLPRQRSPAAAYRPGQRLVIGLVAAACIAGVVASHQLTPFALILSLTALVVVARSPFWEMPVLAAVLTATWLAFPAYAFMAGHAEALLAGVGDAGAAAQSNLGDRVLAGTPEHKTVVLVRLALPLAVWTAAVLGVRALHRRGIPWGTPLALLAAPFVLLPLQSYGGEMLIRVYLLSLPFAAYLAAEALLGRRRLEQGSSRVLGGLVLLLVGVVLFAATSTARYGNERAESFTEDGIGAFAWVYDHAADDSVVLSLTQNAPWRFDDYAVMDHRTLVRTEPGTGELPPLTTEAVLDAMNSAPGKEGYVVYTPSQPAMADLYEVIERDDLERLVRELRGSGSFVVVHRDGPAVVLQRTAT